MADLHHTWSDAHQDGNTTLEWTMQVATDALSEHYWGFSVRPTQFNSVVEVLRHWTVTDNGHSWTEHLMVQTRSPLPGSGLRFSAIWVVGS